jgi:hypothetical protein
MLNINIDSSELKDFVNHLTLQSAGKYFSLHFVKHSLNVYVYDAIY